MKKNLWHKIVSFLGYSNSQEDHTVAHQEEYAFDSLLNRQRSIIYYIHELIREKDPDTAIQTILTKLLDFLNVDHVCIIEYDIPRGVTNCTYEALRENVISIKESCRALPISQFTWWTEQIKKDIPIVFSKLEDMPAEGALAKQKMEEQGVKSIMVVPFISKDEGLGYICADTTHEYRNWSDNDYQWFFSFSNVISIYIELRRRETNKILAINKIRQFEDVFKLIADYAKVGYAQYNAVTKDGYAADSWYHNVGATPDMPLRDLLTDMPNIYPDDRDVIRTFAEQALTGETDTLRANIRIMRENGLITWTCFNCLVRDFRPQEGMVDVMCINYDITEQKEMEASLVEACNKAEASDRLKSAFLANVSHEIRTPLNSIIGFSDLLADCDEPEERREYADIIKKNNNILLQLISDILDISKIESGTLSLNLEKLEVKSLCTEIIHSYQTEATDEVQILLEHGLQKYHILSDNLRIRQIISNFINNAIKFTESGSITLGYQRISDKELKFYVRDTGMGIPADKIHTIFERFVKLDAFVPGTGLGLSICQRLVEQMHGTIGVESKEGEGSCFWFTHPLA